MAGMNNAAQASMFYSRCGQMVKADYSVVPIHFPTEYLPSPGDEGDACIGRPGKHKHDNDHKGNLCQLPLGLDGLLLDQGGLPHLRAQLLHVSAGTHR